MAPNFQCSSVRLSFTLFISVSGLIPVFLKDVENLFFNAITQYVQLNGATVCPVQDISDHTLLDGSKKQQKNLKHSFVLC